ncbi:MAG: hypothetical protein EOP07_19420 [Proteobacteria bacterium]|nr:MAG: hypothetical protein EOP07_19420 [Pseudomonadota bacterium]
MLALVLSLLSPQSIVSKAPTALPPQGSLYAFNMVPPEPGTTTGCTWSGPEPAPDLVGEPEKNINLEYLGKGVKAVVTARKKSEYFVKGYISDQDPLPCASWPNARRELQLTISSGKSEPEAVFVEIPGKGFFPYVDSFGAPSMDSGQCITAKGYKVYDIGTQITDKFYDADACRPNVRGFQTEHFVRSSLKIKVTYLGQLDQPATEVRSNKVPLKTKGGRIKMEFTANNNEVVGIRLASDPSTYIHPIAPGFLFDRLSENESFGYGIGLMGNRIRQEKQVGNGKSYVLFGTLKISPNLKPGEYWINFAFKNLLTENYYNISDPVKIPVLP